MTTFETTDLGPVTGEMDAPSRRFAVRSGDRIGRYVVLERLGAGGMGVVFSAYDAELDRKVAIKLLRADHRDGQTSQQRLLREAQAMAKVDHPNVITVHDVGTHEGHVFIAMEFVAGRTLRQWLEAEQRSWRDVVPVIRQAADGLAAAHEVGLVHRDIKPDNIMVSDDAQRVRVMDFGLVRASRSLSSGPPRVESSELLEPEMVDEASLERGAMDRIRARMADLGKLEQQELEAAATMDVSESSPSDQHSGEASKDAINADLTRTGAVLGTPAYMAPEQLSGQPVTEAADQFALAICLYEALYGSRPFTGSTFAELAANLLDGSVEIPSSPVIPASLHRAMLRGLSKDPADRYGSMTEFGQALSTAPPRRGALLLVGAAALVVGFFAANAVDDGSTGPCTGAEDELAFAWTPQRHEEARTTIVDTGVGFAAREWDSVGPQLEAYARSWADQYTHNCEATTIRKEQSEALMDRRRRCLVRARGELLAAMDVLTTADAGTVERLYDIVQGLPDLQRCSESGALDSEVPPPAPDQVASVEAVEQELAKTNAALTSGRLDDAKNAMARANDSARAVEYDPLSTEILLVRARLDQAVGRNEDAARNLREAHALAAEHGQWQLVVDAGLALSRVYGLDLAKYGESRLLSDLTRGMVRRLDSPVDEAELLYVEAMVLIDQADFETARTKLTDSLNIVQRELGPDHREVDRRRFGLARIDYQEGNLDASERTHRDILAAEEKLLGRQHPTTAKTRDELATVLYAKGEYEAAEKMQRQALADLQAAVGTQHPDVAIFRTHLGLSLGALRRYTEAEEQERQAMAIRRAHLPPDHPDIAQSHNNLAVSLLDQKRYDEAAEEYRAALSIVTDLWGAEHPNVIVAEFGLGTTLLAAERREEALVHLEHVWSVRKDSGSAARRARAASRLARALAPDPEQRSRAKELTETAIEAYKEAGPPFDELRADAESFLAELIGRMPAK